MYKLLKSLFDMNPKILNHYNESLRVFKLLSNSLPKIEEISKFLFNIINKKKQIFVYGNGGSFADSSHFVAELTATYENKFRKPLPFYLLASNAAAVTAWSNDFNYINYATRELSAYAKKGDCLILLSTSGGNFKKKQSLNLVKLAQYSIKNKIYLISLLGKGGGVLKKYSDKYIIIPSSNTGTIQEAHKMILHSFCAFMDHSF